MYKNKVPPNPRPQATLTREFFTSEAPGSPAKRGQARGQAQPKLLIEQIRAVLLPPLPPLREGGREGRSPMLIARRAGPRSPRFPRCARAGARADHHSRILIAPPLPRIKRGAGESITTPIAKPSGDASPDSRGQARGQAGGKLSRQPLGVLLRKLFHIDKFRFFNRNFTIKDWPW
jgi:hypothetical protein